MINYYVDPGSGFIFVQNTSFLWGVILGLLGTLFFLFRFFLGFFKKFLWVFFILCAIFIIGGIIMHKDRQNNKVIILGVDAMDPHITEQLIQQGRLPNFSYLKTIGSYSPLSTTIPSESVVAWASFATGLQPGSHGIFDFIMRDPKTYLPYLSLSDISNVRGEVKIQTHRKGDTFWNILSRNKIPCFIYFCPNTFPPEPLFGKMLSGMGVPDISGTMGKFSFYTTKAPSEQDKDSRGRIKQVVPDKNVILTALFGPKVIRNGYVTESTAPLMISLKPDEETVQVYLQNRRFFLKKGTWSDWQKVTFKIGLFRRAQGILKFYLKSVRPEFELYCSPINFDPEMPLFPISYPKDYSSKLVKKTGLYYTQGMPNDTWALTEDRLDAKTFLEQMDEVLLERERILEEELKKFEGGAFFFYFDTLDTAQHMFWRYIDHKHPLYEKNPSYEDVIFRYYEKIDRIVGKVLKGLHNDATLIILSDHGFASFRKAVHLNRWLLENGYLFLKEETKESKELFEDVDWSKTKAYAVGFGGIYLNRVGREYYGIVDENEVHDLKESIVKKLKDFEDTANGQKVIKNVYLSEDIFLGPYINDAPDLFVGFNDGYRASWQTALGGAANMLLEDNKKEWSGDHLIDASLVPGVIFVNKKINFGNPSIIDIAPSILDLFGITKPKEIRGVGLFKK
jgi:predicted AlkP superfamily phosphohydrolase/phosphomutase